METKILNTIKELKEKSKKRNFSQTFDLIVILKEIDLKKPENRFSEDVVLPRGRGESASIVVFSDRLKDIDCETIGSNDIEKLSKDKRAVKKMVSKTQFFLAEAPLMPVVGKALGQFLAPRGKMPKIITGDATQLVKNLKKSVRIKIKDAPVIQCLVGNEDMSDEDVTENIESVLEFLNTKLPKGKHNIGRVLIKLTMSEPIKVM
jgi:large subunit ribosomal protein L1